MKQQGFFLWEVVMTLVCISCVIYVIAQGLMMNMRESITQHEIILKDIPSWSS